MKKIIVLYKINPKTENKIKIQEEVLTTNTEDEAFQKIFKLNTSNRNLKTFYKFKAYEDNIKYKYWLYSEYNKNKPQKNKKWKLKLNIIKGLKRLNNMVIG